MGTPREFLHELAAARRRAPRAIGCAIVHGIGTLGNQGVIGVKYWTGRDPDPAIMRAALARALRLRAEARNGRTEQEGREGRKEQSLSSSRPLRSSGSKNH